MTLAPRLRLRPSRRHRQRLPCRSPGAHADQLVGNDAIECCNPDDSERGVVVRSLREVADTSTPTGRAVVSIMASIAELKLELDRERRAASREAGVARGL